MSAPSPVPRDWDRLDRLVKRLSGSGRRDAEEIREFWRLYRAATARLATLQASASRPTEELWYLNRLVTAAHAVLYRDRPGKGLLARTTEFLVHGWPRTVREEWRLVALATAIFLVGGAAGIFYAAVDPGFVSLVAPPEILASIERGEMWTDNILGMQQLASGFIFSNNLMVGVMAFGAGITAGLGTAWVLFMNGVLFGAISQVIGVSGMAVPFWSFVSAHGALEFPAIFIAGAGGLALGRGILFPGAQPRARSIARGGRRALALLAGTVPVFLAAAAVEGFFSPEPGPLWGKLLAAALLGGLLLFWLAVGGRRGESAA